LTIIPVFFLTYFRTRKRKYCLLDQSDGRLQTTAMDLRSFTTRAYERILKVVIPIAALNGSENISTKHDSEAITYQPSIKRAGQADFS